MALGQVRHFIIALFRLSTLLIWVGSALHVRCLVYPARFQRQLTGAVIGFLSTSMGHAVLKAIAMSGSNLVCSTRVIYVNVISCSVLRNNVALPFMLLRSSMLIIIGFPGLFPVMIGIIPTCGVC